MIKWRLLNRNNKIGPEQCPLALEPIFKSDMGKIENLDCSALLN
jgi:hypothetical protein